MPLYQNVIVPFDGTLPARTALAPAADLAWRTGGRVVIVNNTDASDEASRDALKSRAMSMSGADVDFWVDTEHSAGRALVEAARHRADPIVCIAVRTRTRGLRRKPVLDAIAAEVLRDAPCPVLLIGPNTDVSRGLAVAEIVVSLDGSEASEAVLPVAVAWARELKLRMTIVGVVREGAGAHGPESAYLDAHVGHVVDDVPDATFELVEAVDPATGLVRCVSRRRDAVLAMSTHGRSGGDASPVGGVAQAVMLQSPRPMLFVRPPTRA